MKLKLELSLRWGWAKPGRGRSEPAPAECADQPQWPATVTGQFHWSTSPSSSYAVTETE